MICASYTRKCLWALACISTSAHAATAQDAFAEVRALELEAELAGTPDLYLVLTPEPPSLVVSARGKVLDRTALADVELEATTATALEIPTVWEVATGPMDPTRQVIVPSSLREWDGAEEATPADREAPEPAAGAPQSGTSEPITPTAYLVQLTNGWELWVDRPTDRGPLGRWLESVARGWRALWGRPIETPPRVILDLDPDDARQLHHLFRSGLRILVRPPRSEAVQEEEPTGATAAPEAIPPGS
jgi:hypothetical protein